jgi:hypothetical protein
VKKNQLARQITCKAGPSAAVVLLLLCAITCPYPSFIGFLHAVNTGFEFGQFSLQEIKRNDNGQTADAFFLI